MIRKMSPPILHQSTWTMVSGKDCHTTLHQGEQTGDDCIFCIQRVTQEAYIYTVRIPISIYRSFFGSSTLLSPLALDMATPILHVACSLCVRCGSNSAVVIQGISIYHMFPWMFIRRYSKHRRSSRAMFVLFDVNLRTFAVSFKVSGRLGTTWDNMTSCQTIPVFGPVRDERPMLRISFPVH